MKNGPFECLSIRVWSGNHDFINLSHHNKTITNLCRSIESPLHDTERGEPGAACLGQNCAGRGQDRTACTVFTFKLQAILYYNQLPAGYRSLNQNQFKAAVTWRDTSVIPETSFLLCLNYDYPPFYLMLRVTAIHCWTYMAYIRKYTYLPQ